MTAGHVHPDWNHEQVPWLESTNGKRWKVKAGVNALPVFQTLEGIKYDPPPFRPSVRTESRRQGESFINAIVARNDIVHESVRYMSLSNVFDVFNRVTVLLDTGAMGKEANFVNERVVTLLIARGYKVCETDRVVDALSSRHIITKKIKFALFVKCHKTLEITKIAVEAMVIPMQYDVIIGFECIQKNEILKELLIEGLESDESRILNCSSELTRRDSAAIDVRVDHSCHRGGRNLTVGVRAQLEDELVVENLDNLPKIQCESLELAQKIRKICVEHKRAFSGELNKEAARIEPMRIELTGGWKLKENQLHPRIQVYLNKLRSVDRSKRCCSQASSESRQHLLGRK